MHCCLLPTHRRLQSSWSSHGSHLTALGWSLPPFSRHCCSLPMMFCRNSSPGVRYCRTSELISFLFSFVIHSRLLRWCFRHCSSSDISVPSNFWIRLSLHPSTSIVDSSAIEFCCTGVSATAELLCICELATAVAAFIARLLLASEASGIGTSFNSCGAATSPAVFPTSFRRLAFLSTSCASASFHTSLLRSRRSAPSGVVLRHASILTRQGSE